MPISLPPLSRRAFLRRSLIVGAGLACVPELLAADKHATDVNSWALFADTHIAADSKKVEKAVNMADHLAAATRDVLSLPKRPAGVFVVGDCALSKGEPGDYTQIAGLIEPLRAGGMPVHLALGNHDQRENFRAALETQKLATRPVADRQVALIRSEQVNWFVLDSLEKTLQTPGALGADQLKWLAETLDANAELPAVVLIHHNPGLDGNIGLKDTEALWEILRPRRQVKAWVYGHTHTWKVTQDESGIHLVNLPPVSYIFRPGNPAGWVHATAHPDGLKLRLQCVDREHPSHGQVVDLKWRDA